MDTRIQTGALPWRRSPKDGLQLLLVTGRWSKRWIIPKGWPMRGKSLAKAAAQEAYEEAGVRGTIEEAPLGTFRHIKRMPSGDLEVEIVVHVLTVERELDRWPERLQRERRWFKPEEAAALVEAPGLREMILGLETSLGTSQD